MSFGYESKMLYVAVNILCLWFNYMHLRNIIRTASKTKFGPQRGHSCKRNDLSCYQKSKKLPFPMA